MQPTNSARDRYLSIIDGMLYGDDAFKQGFIRNNDFIHPELGFAFTVPNGFEMRNTSNAVIAQSRATGAQMQFTAANSQSTPRAILENELSQQLKVDFRPVQDGTVANRPGGGRRWAVANATGRD